MILHVLKSSTFDSVDKLPKKAKQRSTGLDVKAASEPKIEGQVLSKTDTQTIYSRIDYIEYGTDLKVAVQQKTAGRIGGHISLEEDYDLLALPNSRVSAKTNLVLGNSVGLIDADYRGEIFLRFKYIPQPEDLVLVDGKFGCIINQERLFKKGDVVCQLKATKIVEISTKLVDVLDQTSRGEGGFGSTETSAVEIHPAKMLTDLVGAIPTAEPRKRYIDTIKEREKSI